MVNWRNEKGKGALKAFIILIIIGLAIYLLYEFFPTFWKPYEFKSTIAQEAMNASSRPGYERELHQRLLEKAQKLGLNVDPSKLIVEIRSERVKIIADYYMEVKTIFYTFRRHFVHEVENPIYH